MPDDAPVISAVPCGDGGGSDMKPTHPDCPTAFRIRDRNWRLHIPARTTRLCAYRIRRRRLRVENIAWPILSSYPRGAQGLTSILHEGRCFARRRLRRLVMRSWAPGCSRSLKFPQGRVVRARKESTRCCGLCREGHAVCGKPVPIRARPGNGGHPASCSPHPPVEHPQSSSRSHAVEPVLSPSSVSSGSSFAGPSPVPSPASAWSVSGTVQPSARHSRAKR